jgi:hypothetical protein
MENVEYFSYVDSLITNDARCTREIKSRIAMAKAAFNKKKTIFTSKLDLNLRKKLVKCYIWSIGLYGAETWTLQKVDQKYLKYQKTWHRENSVLFLKLRSGQSSFVSKHCKCRFVSGVLFIRFVLSKKSEIEEAKMQVMEY